MSIFNSIKCTLFTYMMVSVKRKRVLPKKGGGCIPAVTLLTFVFKILFLFFACLKAVLCFLFSAIYATNELVLYVPNTNNFRLLSPKSIVYTKWPTQSRADHSFREMHPGFCGQLSR